MNSRVSWSESNGTIECRIGVWKDCVSFAFFTPCTVLLTIGMVHAINGTLELADSHLHSVLLAVLAWLTATYGWLRVVFGRETVRLDRTRLAVKTGVFGLGRTRAYDIALIRDFGERAPFGPPNTWLLTLYSFVPKPQGIYRWPPWEAAKESSKGTIGFTYEGKERRFGLKLYDNEAQAIVKRLKPYLPESAFTESR